LLPKTATKSSVSGYKVAVSGNKFAYFQIQWHLFPDTNLPFVTMKSPETATKAPVSGIKLPFPETKSPASGTSVDRSLDVS